VLVGLGWLAPVTIDEWRQERLPALERGAQTNLSKISDAMAGFRRLARQRGLEPSGTDYVARTRDRRCSSRLAASRRSKMGTAPIASPHSCQRPRGGGWLRPLPERPSWW
jgi:hypothetical protein